MRIKTLILSCLCFIFSCTALYSGSDISEYIPYVDRFLDKNADRVYLRDTIRWENFYWTRKSTYYFSDDPHKKIWYMVTLPDIKTEVKNYENRDMVFYKDSSYDGEDPYWRRNEEKVIVTDGPLDRPYVRLGTFTVAVPKPPKWKKYKKSIKLYGYWFTADAVKVEGWEILPFKREDFSPVTEFKSGDEYVLFHCVAVAFADTVPLTRDELEKYIRRRSFLLNTKLTIDTAAEARKK